MRQKDLYSVCAETLNATANLGYRALPSSRTPGGARIKGALLPCPFAAFPTGIDCLAQFAPRAEEGAIVFGVQRVAALSIIAAAIALSACGSSLPGPFDDGLAVFACHELDGERYIELGGEWVPASEFEAVVDDVEVDESKRAFAAWVKDCTS